MESRNAKFLENDLISGSDQSQDLVSVRDQPSTSSQRLVIMDNITSVQLDIEQLIIEEPQAADDLLVDEVTLDILELNEPLDIPELNEQPVEQRDPLVNVDQH